jgi:HK97 family phage major capsid protein
MAKKQLQRAQLDQLLGKKLKRAMPLQRAEMTIDEEARTVEMSFSSDVPVEHWFGKLILNHAPGCVRLDRINNGGAFLSEHDRTKQIGVHVDGTVKTDGHKTRGTVRFSRSPLGIQEFQDVLDEIRRHTSVGAMLYELHFVRETEEEGPVYQSDDWEPIENSLVSIPADVTTGIGRALGDLDFEALTAEMLATEERDGKEQQAEELTNRISGTADEGRAQQSTTQVRTKTVEEELITLAEMLGEVELARDFIAAGTVGEAQMTEFRAAVQAKRKKAQTPTPTEDPGTTAERSGGDSVQLARTVTRAQLKAFRGQDGARQAHRFGNFIAAALHRHEPAIQFCREQGIQVRRAHSEGDNESGGFLVPTEFEQTIIDLRLEYGVFRPNSNVVPMSGARKERPKRKGGLKAYPIGAGKNNRRLTESKQDWGLVGLDPKKWGVLAKYEEELSEDWLMATGDNFASESAYAFAQVEDECGFIGDGSSDYHGIVGVIPKLQGLSGTVGNIAGIVVASGNTWDEIVKEDILKLVGRLPSFARKSGQVKWYCTNEFWATVLCRIALSMGGATMAEIEGEMRKVFLGIPVEDVEVMPHVEANSQIPLLYGNLAQAAEFGDRRGMTVKMTNSNGDDFEEDIEAYKATERFDINVHDVGNADATPSKRKAGSIVALQTAAG